VLGERPAQAVLRISQRSCCRWRVASCAVLPSGRQACRAHPCHCRCFARQPTPCSVGMSRVVTHLQVGADLCMGSLIKSPGGTLATTGGYIAGRADLVAAAGARLTAPGIGLDAGAVPSETLRLMYQGAVPRLLRRWNSASAAVLLSSVGCVVERLEAGRLSCRAGLFLAPQMMGEALKGGRLLAAVAARCGIAASPPHGLLDRLGAVFNSLPIEAGLTCPDQRAL
jgi:Methionine gamma-lyase